MTSSAVCPGPPDVTRSGSTTGVKWITAQNALRCESLRLLAYATWRSRTGAPTIFFAPISFVTSIQHPVHSKNLLQLRVPLFQQVQPFHVVGGHVGKPLVLRPRNT